MNLRQSAQLEELEKRRIEYKRKQNEERIQRLRNTKNWQVGMDYDFLAKQIEEKKAREAAEKAEEEDYARRFLEEQRLLRSMSNQEQKIRKEIDLENNKFRLENQKPEQSREYDIWRNDYKKVQNTEQPEKGIHRFSGEDSSSVDRNKRQREQLLNWQTQQMLEKEHREALALQEQREWEQKYAENSKRMEEIEQQTRAARKEMQRLVDEENYRAMLEKRRQQQEEKYDESMANIETQNTFNDTFLNESKNQSVSPGRYGRSTQDWRGMTDEQKLQIIEERRSQMLAAQKKKVEEAERERKEEMERMRASRDALRKENQDMREKRSRAIEQANEYLKVAEEKNALKKQLGKEDNQPQDEFWNYFGK